jgi:catechol 2,3-dioxygenase-like lactoylglutathione lyase family enzyme
MTSDSSASSTLTWARLVPEFLVTDIEKSLRFWRDLCGFTVLFDRPDEGFAYLDLGGAQISWMSVPEPEIGRRDQWKFRSGAG